MPAIQTAPQILVGLFADLPNPALMPVGYFFYASDTRQLFVIVPTRVWGEVSLPASIDPAAGVPGLRTLGLGPQQAAPGTTLVTAQNYADNGDLLTLQNAQAYVDAVLSAVSGFTTPTAYPYKIVATDSYVLVDTSALRLVHLDSTLPTNKEVTILDGTGSANLNPVSIDATSGLILGSNSINSSRGHQKYKFDGVNWRVI